MDDPTQGPRHREPLLRGCNRTGLDGHGGEYCGDSAVVDYKGHALTPADDLITATLDKGRLDAFRQKWPFYLDFD